MRPVWRAVLGLVALLGAPGCGDDDRPAAGGGGPHSQGDARVGGHVVSTVDGEPITVEQVRRRAQADRIAPREALRRLQDDLLLAAEAERRGLGRLPAVRADARRAAVQALLEAEVERAVPEPSIDDEAIRRAYERHRDRYVRPEGRASIHALARLDAGATADADAAARARIEAFLAELRAAPDAAASVEQRIAAGGVSGLHLESVPPLARDADAEESYKAALFALPRPGLWPEPVRSGYGWHAIVLTVIVPARHVSLEEATPELRRAVLDSRRRARVAELIEELARRMPVEPNQAAVRAALQQDPDAPRR